MKFTCLDLNMKNLSSIFAKIIQLNVKMNSNELTNFQKYLLVQTESSLKL